MAPQNGIDPAGGDHWRRGNEYQKCKRTPRNSAKREGKHTLPRVACKARHKEAAKIYNAKETGNHREEITEDRILNEKVRTENLNTRYHKPRIGEILQNLGDKESRWINGKHDQIEARANCNKKGNERSKYSGKWRTKDRSANCTGRGLDPPAPQIRKSCIEKLRVYVENIQDITHILEERRGVNPESIRRFWPSEKQVHCMQNISHTLSEKLALATQFETVASPPSLRPYFHGDPRHKGEFIENVVVPSGAAIAFRTLAII